MTEIIACSIFTAVQAGFFIPLANDEGFSSRMMFGACFGTIASLITTTALSMMLAYIVRLKVRSVKDSQQNL